MGRAVGAADVGVGPDVFLPGQDAVSAAAHRLFQGQLLQRVRHAAVAHGHQPDSRVAGAHAATAVRERDEHDRAVAAPVPVPPAATVAEHVRHRRVRPVHRRQAGDHRHQHTHTASEPLLPVLHRLRRTAGAHQSRQHPVRGHATVLRRHQQVGDNLT